MTGLLIQLRGGDLRLFSMPDETVAADQARMAMTIGGAKFAAVVKGKGNIVQRLKPKGRDTYAEEAH